MKKQFDLQYYLEYPETKVVTRDGRKARIICTDLKNANYPISAAIIEEDSYQEFVEIFTSKGKFNYALSEEHNIDLFFDLPDPIKKKVPLTYEDLLERIKQGKTMWISSNSKSYMKCIIGCNKDSVSMINLINSPSVEKFQYQEFMECSFIDGDPCWKEVEE